jgi:phage-related protein
MGFWDSLWGGISNIGKNIWSGIKGVGQGIYNVVKKPIEWASTALDYAKKVPGLGTLLAPVSGIVEGAKSALGTAETVADVVKKIGLKEGGLVAEKMPKKMYQA